MHEYYTAMKSLILLTTAIPRGNLHKKTINLFYDKLIFHQ